MTSTTTSDVYYALREKQQPYRLVRLDIRNNDDGDYCNETRTSLSFYEGDPLFRASSARIAAKVLVVDTPWYNSDEEHPQWGNVDVSKLEVIKIEEVVTTTTTKMEIDPPLVVEILDAYSSTRSKCSKLLGRELPAEKYHNNWSVRVVELPLNATLESFNAKCTETTIMFGKHSPSEYYSWGAFELSLDDVSKRGNSRAVGVVTSNYPDNFQL